MFLLYCRDANDNRSINTPDRDNNTPLHIAAGKGKSENVEVRDLIHVIYPMHVMFPQCVITEILAFEFQEKKKEMAINTL